MRTDLITSAHRDRRPHRALRPRLSAGRHRRRQVAFPARADGSQIERDGKRRRLAADRREELPTEPVLARPRYFQSRPSPTGYNAAGTAFTNLGPNSNDLRDSVRGSPRGLPGARAALQPGPHRARRARRRGHDLGLRRRPAHLAGQRARSRRTASPPCAGCRSRGSSTLIDENTDGRSLGVLGEPGVNVLELNLALDEEAPPMTEPAPQRCSRSQRTFLAPGARSTRCASSTRACRSATR